MNSAQAIDQHLKRKAKEILIVTHQDPDIDALGSSLAFKFYLEGLGLKPTLWAADAIEKFQTFLPGIDGIVQTYTPSENLDTVIVLDCSNLERVKDLSLLNLDRERITFINIDHHADNTLFGDINHFFILSSVGEILFRLFEELKWTITSDIATLLYAAIIFDTGRFLYSNTTADTLDAASQLVKCGADREMVSLEMYENKSLSTFNVIKTGLDRLVVNEDKGYAYSTLPKNIEEKEIKLIDFIRQIGSADVFVMFKENDDGDIQMNFRSKSSFNVQEIAAAFGGGGHIKAAGAKVTGSLEQVVRDVTSLIESKLSQHHV